MDTTGNAAAVPAAPRTELTDPQRFLLAGFVVALLDMSFAQTYWVVIRQATTFARVVQSIAAGLLGKAAFQGGGATVVLGAICHCVVAFGWAGVFLLAARRWHAFRRVLDSRGGALKVGVPFGMLVWIVMDLVVIPLSRARPTPVASSWFFVSLFWHAVGVGPPMAIVFRRPAHG